MQVTVVELRRHEVQSHPACLPARSREEFFREVIPVTSRDKTQLEEYTTA